MKKDIYLAGGCFWGAEHYLKRIRGVVSTETGYANYSAPGYLNRYDANGKLIKKYDIGVGPVAILFNTGVEYTRK